MHFSAAFFFIFSRCSKREVVILNNLLIGLDLLGGRVRLVCLIHLISHPASGRTEQHEPQNIKTKRPLNQAAWLPFAEQKSDAPNTGVEKQDIAEPDEKEMREAKQS